MEKTPFWKILIPVAIGILVIALMIANESGEVDWYLFTPTVKSCLMILSAFLFMVLRDLGYIIRIRLFSEKFLSWKQSFKVIMLWEFTSSITPSSVGGAAVATVFVHKEGLSVGKSAAMVILTALMDELFFVIVFPLVALIVGFEKVFALNSAVITLISVGYCVKLLLASALIYALFFNPKGFSKIIIGLFSLPILKRWKEGAEHTGRDIIIASDEIKNYKISFWFKSMAATSLSWCSRFLVANSIFAAFFTLSDNVLVFVRQMAMWIPMIIAPTPGGSGFAEYIFTQFLSDVTSSIVLTSATTAFIALLWRIVTYYPYLIVGTLIIPRWVADKFSKKR